LAKFVVARLSQGLVLLLIVSIAGFTVLHLAPGGPLAQFAFVPGISEADALRVAAQMGLNRPLAIQYFDWLSRLVQGDWGYSYRDSQSVISVISSRLPATLELMATSMLIAAVIGGAIGILGAARRYSIFDTLATVGAMVALSIPTFWFGLVVIYVFSVKLDWLPPGNRFSIGDGSIVDLLHHLIAPALVLALVEIAIWSRYMRSAMLDEINQDYIRTAKAKGLSYRKVLVRHGLRNALLPMITLIGLHIPSLLGGALVTETVFTWPGIGRLFLDSLNFRDYPVVMGLLMFSAFLVIIGNLLADICCAIADPRIRTN
jgi:peptide/nickel transport system permease protein